MANVQYQVREVTRWIVTRWHQDEAGAGSSVIAYFESEQNAHTVAASLMAHEGSIVEVNDVEDSVADISYNEIS